MPEIRVAAALITEAEKHYLQSLGEGKKTRMLQIPIVGDKGRDPLSDYLASKTNFDFDLTEMGFVDEFQVELPRLLAGRLAIRAQVFQVLLPIADPIRVIFNDGKLAVIQGEKEVKQADGGFLPLTQQFFRRHYGYEPEHNES